MQRPDSHERCGKKKCRYEIAHRVRTAPGIRSWSGSSGEKITYVGRTETERKLYQYRLNLRHVERTQQNSYGLVVSSVEQNEIPAPSVPDPQSKINSPDGIPAWPRVFGQNEVRNLASQPMVPKALKFMFWVRIVLFQ